MVSVVSRHAALRMNQRGVRKSDLEFLVAHADIVIPCNRGGSTYLMTERGYHALLEVGIPVQVADRIRRITAIVSWDGVVVTVMKLSGTRGKRYRRDEQFDRRGDT